MKAAPPEKKAPMSADAAHSLNQLRAALRPAALARIGGFRPPDDPTASWFGAAVAAPGEGAPLWNGAPMFPLLQIRVADLPVVPPALAEVALLVLFHGQCDHPFNRPHGEGWLIREYPATAGLVALPPVAAASAPRPFPVAWDRVEDDAPGWETALGIVDMAPICADTDASHRFHHDFHRYDGTKVGGYPCEIQHGNDLEDFVFQVGSDAKSRWQWADAGIGYFCKDPDQGWSWSCQFL